MIDKATAAKIAEILVVECGASASLLKDWGFEAYVTGTEHIEFRFQGHLGWGGKFRADSGGGRWRVDAYPEDETPQRLRMIAKANARLKELEGEVKRPVG